MERWISDTPTSERFPVYTRGNADEVGPEPFTPLGWSLVWEEGMVPGTAHAWMAVGALTEDEFDWSIPETYGCWGGYFFNQVSCGRIFGARVPGGSPDLIDQAFFGGNPNVPKYVADPRDVNPERTEALGARIGYILGGGYGELMSEFIARAEQWLAQRPDFSTASDQEVLAYGIESARWQDPTWTVYGEVLMGGAIPMGMAQGVAAALGRPDLAVDAFAAIGDVDSAELPNRVWVLSRLVNASPSLTVAFDAGVEGVRARLESADGGAEFLGEFDRLMADFGHRGVNEWEVSADTWATNPELAFAMVDRIRKQSDSDSPASRFAVAAARREASIAELTALAAGDEATAGMLAAGLAAGTQCYQLRERGKNMAVRLMLEPKLAFRELGRRMHERGAISDPSHIFMVMRSELEGFVEDPTELGAVLAERAAEFATLKDLEPPYFVVHGQPIPPISEWKSRKDSTGDAAAAGAVLTGIGGSPGVTTAKTRVILDIRDADQLEPGEVLVCPTTDPSWVPLFMLASAVVCEIGAPASHAIIVGRELGVPCVVSVAGARHSIPTGTTVTVDGSSGTITVL